ncbi:hypothetical protein ASPZODRAFT_12777 [Penicilliopsis zonata CBS 506.65]|uniref:Uncharacterized protein n=1 Tax=Penicilliopsis zonata CBS 506.65 TaxID=1073090 RepID=A0A1L9SRC2_9EURO|nr:hypothetical protein ASPZODRAFT_12777 [Penicilliopsis zonata CBS 506.65]OJJ49657.1 hypothetical protein ASPZODRAFT_12777 [Penicilliopsis zonata CBS 506.65]
MNGTYTLHSTFTPLPPWFSRDENNDPILDIPLCTPCVFFDIVYPYKNQYELISHLRRLAMSRYAIIGDIGEERGVLSVGVQVAGYFPTLDDIFIALSERLNQLHTLVDMGILATGGKSEADLLVEELQELYEAAKDEFEIATESTDSATIYAASDRESARDALNQLVSVYTLYTTPIEVSGSPTKVDGAQQQEQENQIEDLGETDQGQLITTNYDPTEIAQGVRDEVKKRVGHRLRELVNAVENLEERAHAE